MQLLSPSNSGRALAARGAVLRAVLALLSVHLLAGSGAAQWSKDPLTNYVMNRATGVKSIGDYAAEGIAAAGQLTAIKVRLGGDLAAARHAFWREYPNGAGLAEAAARFAQLLKTKDDYYWMVYSQRSNPTMGAINALTGGDVDGGIPIGARKTFLVWADQLSRNLGGGQLNAKTLELLMNPAKAREERRKAEPLYLDYRLRRDWEEFRAKGVKPPNVEQAFWEQALFGFKLRENAGITDREANIDPYSYAFETWQGRDALLTWCAGYIPQLTSRNPQAACQCIQGVLQANLEPRDLEDLRKRINEEMFLLATVLRVGLHAKVGACLR
jgi:hypothetical protein